MIRRSGLACLVVLALLPAPAPVAAQDHPCESDSVRARGGEHLSAASVSVAEGIEIRKRTTAQEPVPGYFYCVVDFAWQESREAWRQNDANFEAYVASVKKVEAERKRSVPISSTPRTTSSAARISTGICVRWETPGPVNSGALRRLA
jgi:hypothetical protein